MLLQFTAARVLDAGYYEIKNVQGGFSRYPWVELIQRRDELPADYPGRDSTGPSRYSVEMRVDDRGDLVSCRSFEGVPFGTMVSGYFEVADSTKVIRGTDRSVDLDKLKVVAWEVVDATARPKPAEQAKAS